MNQKRVKEKVWFYQNVTNTKEYSYEILIYIVIFNSQLPTFNDAWKYEMKTTETRGTVSSTELHLRLAFGGNRLALKMLHAREIDLLF